MQWVAHFLLFLYGTFPSIIAFTLVSLFSLIKGKRIWFPLVLLLMMEVASILAVISRYDWDIKFTLAGEESLLTALILPALFFWYSLVFIITEVVRNNQKKKIPSRIWSLDEDLSCSVTISITRIKASLIMTVVPIFGIVWLLRNFIEGVYLAYKRSDSIMLNIDYFTFVLVLLILVETFQIIRFFLEPIIVKNDRIVLYTGWPHFRREYLLKQIQSVSYTKYYLCFSTDKGTRTLDLLFLKKEDRQILLSLLWENEYRG